MRLTKRHTELIPESRQSLTKGAISYILEKRMLVAKQDKDEERVLQGR